MNEGLPALQAAVSEDDAANVCTNDRFVDLLVPSITSSSPDPEISQASLLCRLTVDRFCRGFGSVARESSVEALEE